jgi:hypothetical protein
MSAITCALRDVFRIMTFCCCIPESLARPLSPAHPAGGQKRLIATALKQSSAARMSSLPLLSQIRHMLLAGVCQNL